MGRDSTWTAQIWDEQRGRPEALSNALKACGARVRRVSDVEGPFAELTLVALPSARVFDADVVTALHRLRRAGGRVIGWGPGFGRQPIAEQSHYYLAGFSKLLDSTEPSALETLERLIAPWIRASSARDAELAVARDVMRRFGVIGRSSAMLDVVCRAVRMARVPALPVLIEGETGTGKERLARIIHALDPERAARPLVALNCAALSPDLAEAELFGHARGAFTGAHEERKGLFRAADGGVLLLDEVGDLTPALQTKLLRVLQERRVLAVGSDREVPVDVRVISATSRSLSRLVAAGAFRSDLLHRLDVLSVEMPPLRARDGDLSDLVRYIVERSVGAQGPVAVTPAFVGALSLLRFPGNVRQLENVLQKALVRRDDPAAPLEPADLPAEVWEELVATIAARGAVPSSDPSSGVSEVPLPYSGPLPAPPALPRSFDQGAHPPLAKALASYERELLERAIAETNGNQTLMAGRLRITPRSVYNKLKKHGLVPRTRQIG